MIKLIPDNKEHSLRNVLILGFLLRLLLYLIGQLWVDAHLLKENYVGADGEGYHILAINLLKTGSFETFGGFRTPGYPLYITLLYFIFGYHPGIVVFSQLFLELANILLVYKLGEKILDRNTGILAALIYAVDPHVILISTTLQSEVFFNLTFLSAMYLFVKALKQNSLSIMLASGIVLGASTLVRPILQFFPVVMIGILIFHLSSTVRFRLISSFLILLTFVLVISPWVYRNYRQYNAIALSSIQGANLLFYSAAYVEVVKTGKDIEEVRKDLSIRAAEAGADETFNPVFAMTEEQHWKLGENMVKHGHNPFDNSKIYNAIATDIIKKNIVTYTVRHIKGIFNMYVALESAGLAFRLGFPAKRIEFDYFASKGPVDMAVNFIKSKPLVPLFIGLMVAIYLLIIYCSFLIGAIRMVVEKRYFYLFLLLSVIGYFSALVGVVGLSRYKVPVIPFYSIPAAYGIIFFYHWYKKRRKTKEINPLATY